MADKKFSKTTFGKTYYPITQNDMSSTRFKKFTGNKEDKKNSVNRDQLDKYHKDLKEKLYKEKVRPSEIAKLDKEYKARMKRANDDLQYKLSNRAGMKEARKKQKNTIPDTGSEYAKGGVVTESKKNQFKKNKEGQKETNKKSMKVGKQILNIAVPAVGAAELSKKVLKSLPKKKLSSNISRVRKAEGGSLKAVPASNKGLKKLPTQVRNKMGYMKTGGRVGLKSGGIARRGRGCEIK